MQLTKITVSLGRTQNLGNYNNIKPQVELEAILEPGDSLEQARETLLQEARTIVEAEIDNALERAGMPALYDSVSPRFWTFATKTHGDRRDYVPLPATVTVVPASEAVEAAELDRDWLRLTVGDEYPPRPVRLRQAVAVARRWADGHKGYAFIDCSDGDLSRLPRREAAPAEVAEATPDLPF